MKKKVITALLITMTLTLGSVGTVFAMNNNVAGDEAVNEIREDFIWIVDKEAVYKTVHHEAEYKTVHHEAEYKTVHHEAEYKTVHHEAEGYYEKQQVQVGTKPIYEKQERCICHTCGDIDIGPATDPIEGGMSKEKAEHVLYHISRGEDPIEMSHDWKDIQVGEEPIYEEKDVWIETKPAWDEQILVREAYDEQVLVREAYDEQILVKEAWDEQVLVSPEEGHWESVKNEETKPENPDEDIPEETPELKPDGATPEETPELKPDGATPEETPEPKPDEQTPNKENQNIPQTGNEQKNSEQESGKENTTTVPKTGDPTSFAYLTTLAGSALVGGVSLKFRKRK